MTLHWIDYAVIMIPFVVILVVSWVTRRHMRSVADFMSASRCAGRYLICTSSGEATYGAITVIAIMEYLYKAGFTINWWQNMSAPVGLIIVLTGYVAYRYRETRVMTLAQFFEIRYSRKFRIFAGIVAFVSGIVNYGIFPAVSARFFVYFCGLPQVVPVLGVSVPTFAILMFIFLGFSLFLTLTGGQLTILVTNCLEGLISGVFYIFVAIALLWMFSWSDIAAAMSNAPKGQSLLNPFDTAQATDFNIWFVLIGIFAAFYSQMAWQGGHAFRSSAASAHEAKMGGILGNWRSMARTVMIVLLGICAFTYMHHPRFAAGAAQVNEQLQTIGNPQIRSQMQASVALSHFLPVGIKGMFAAIMFFAMIAVDGSYTHSWGSILIQDVILPFRKKPFTPEQHIRLLRWAITGVTAFGFCFSLLFNQTTYILMFMACTATIFIGGAGCAILGGLYWKKGTTAAAWTGMTSGLVFGVAGMLLGQPGVWNRIPGLLQWGIERLPLLGRWGWLCSLAAHVPSRFPVNAQVVFFFAMLTALVLYALVSLLTHREDFNLDRMLHRGAYAVEGASPASAHRKWNWQAVMGFDREFTRGDKIIAGSVFYWGMFWFVVFVVMSLWYLISPWPLGVWSIYWYIQAVMLPLLVGIVTTVWFTWGTFRDLRSLFVSLRTVTRNACDDGTVVGHQNLDENGK